MKLKIAILITLGYCILLAKVIHDYKSWPEEAARIERNVMLGIKAQCDNQKVPKRMKAIPPQLLLDGEFYYCRPVNVKRREK